MGVIALTGLWFMRGVFTPAFYREQAPRPPVARALDEAVRRRHVHGVREPDEHFEVLALRRGAVPDALDLERLREPARHALDHVRQQRTRQSVQRFGLLLVVGARDHEVLVFELDLDERMNGQLELALGAFDLDQMI